MDGATNQIVHYDNIKVLTYFVCRDLYMECYDIQLSHVSIEYLLSLNTIIYMQHSRYSPP